MFLNILISAFLALTATTQVAVQDTVRVRSGADTVLVYAPVADSVQVSVPAADTSLVYAPAADTVLVYTPADSTACRPKMPVLGISTNIPYDITWVPGYGLTSIPSFSLEFYPRKWKHFTLGADVEWPMWKHWDTHRFFQINNITLWTRRYFPERRDSLQRFQGLYLLGNVNAARYGIGFDANNGWQGEGAGVSLGIGYKCGLGKGRLYFDTGVAFGYFYSRYDPYVWGNDPTGWYYYDYTGDPAEFVPRRMALHWFGPTRVYVSIGLDLTKKVKKKQ